MSLASANLSFNYSGPTAMQIDSVKLSAAKRAADIAEFPPFLPAMGLIAVDLSSPLPKKCRLASEKSGDSEVWAEKVPTPVKTVDPTSQMNASKLSILELPSPQLKTRHVSAVPVETTKAASQKVARPACPPSWSGPRLAELGWPGQTDLPSPQLKTCHVSAVPVETKKGASCASDWAAMLVRMNTKNAASKKTGELSESSATLIPWNA